MGWIENSRVKEVPPEFQKSDSKNVNSFQYYTVSKFVFQKTLGHFFCTPIHMYYSYNML